MKRRDTPAIGFIGAGTTGTALAVRRAQHGYQVIAVSSRSLTSAEKLAARISGCKVYSGAQEVADIAELIFITTPDSTIPQVSADVQWHDGQNVVHCSGAHSVDILETAKLRGANTGCFHPLQTFASVDQAIDNIPGSAFAIEAEEPLASALKEMATTLEGDWVILKAGDKVLYHAAAVFACNYLVPLVNVATDLWQTFVVSPSPPTKSLMPLLKGTLSNL